MNSTFTAEYVKKYAIILELVLRKIKNRGIIYAVLFLIPQIAVITADGQLEFFRGLSTDLFLSRKDLITSWLKHRTLSHGNPSWQWLYPLAATQSLNSSPTWPYFNKDFKNTFPKGPHCLRDF